MERARGRETEVRGGEEEGEGERDQPVRQHREEQPLQGGRLDIVLSERDCDNVNWGKRTTCTGKEARDNNQSTTLQRDCDNMNWNESSTCTGTTS